MKRFALALAAVPLLLAAGAVPTAAASDAHVRLVYLSPDAGARPVDFYLDGSRVLSNADYKTVSMYQSVPAGQHTFEIRPAGAAVSSTPTARIQQALEASYYSVFAGGKVGDPRCGVKGVIFNDGIPSLASGKVAARFVHMAPEVPGVDVKLMDGTVLFRNVDCFQGSSYSTLPTGSYPVQLVGVDSGKSLFTATAQLNRPGIVWTLVGIGGVGEPVSLFYVPDAASAGVVPAGGAGTGMGGAGLGGLLPLGLVAGSLMACALLLLLVRRAPA